MFGYFRSNFNDLAVRKNGVENDRFIAAPKRMPGVTLETDEFETFRDIGSKQQTVIESFLCGYSEAEGNRIELVETVEVADAGKLVQRGHKTFTRRGA